MSAWLFCVVCEVAWSEKTAGSLCFACDQPGARGYRDLYGWGLAVRKTAEENRALAALTLITGGKP